MGARPGPQDDVRLPEIGRHLLALEHGPIGDVARYPRLAVADDLLADLRPHAVAADQRASGDPLAGLQRDGDAAIVLLEALDLPLRLQRDQVVALAGLEEHGMDVGPMGDRIGLPETLDEALIERNAGHLPAAQRAAHLQRARPPDVGQQFLLEAELVDRPENIGAELDAGAELLELAAPARAPAPASPCGRAHRPPPSRRCRRPRSGSARRVRSCWPSWLPPRRPGPAGPVEAAHGRMDHWLDEFARRNRSAGGPRKHVPARLPRSRISSDQLVSRSRLDFGHFKT